MFPQHQHVLLGRCHLTVSGTSQDSVKFFSSSSFTTIAATPRWMFHAAYLLPPQGIHCLSDVISCWLILSVFFCTRKKRWWKCTVRKQGETRVSLRSQSILSKVDSCGWSRHVKDILRKEKIKEKFAWLFGSYQSLIPVVYCAMTDRLKKWMRVQKIQGFVNGVGWT